MEPIVNINIEKPAPIQKLELWQQPYSCPQCILSPELLNINKINGTIKINCPEHKEQEIPIIKSIQELTKSNIYNIKCTICQKKNKCNFPEEQLKYCFDCKKIICKTCLDKHEKQEKNNFMNLDDINSKCNLHLEPFCFYCYQCNKSICHLCISHKEHLYHKKELLNELLTQEINIKEIDSINKEFKKEKENLLKKIEELDNLIKLNELIINSYKNYQNNYEYIMNIKNLMMKNVLKDYKNDLLKKKNLDKFNKANDIYISLNDKTIDLKYEIKFKPKKFSKFCELKLNRLKNLNLKGTAIRDLTPFKGFCFDLIEHLDLSENQINNLKPLEGINIPNLKYLFLNSNYIKNIKPLGTINFPNITILNLGNNKIYNIKIFSNKIFSELRKLNLECNKIEKIDVFRDVEFKNLLELNLFNNYISNINSFSDAPFKNLKRLYLNNNKLNSESLLDLNFSELNKLDLSQNSITDFSFLDKIKINNLKLLNLSHNKIVEIEPIANYDFTKLINLNLSNNNIKNINCLVNAKFVGLKELNLNYNEIEDIESLINIPFKGLKKIKVYQMTKQKDKEKIENVIKKFEGTFKNTKVINDW